MPAQFPPTLRLLGFALGVLLLPLTGNAELVWQGTPALGHQVFNNLNFEGAERYSPGTGTIEPATDPTRGPIWRVFKPAPDKRAEIRGATGWSYHVGQGGSLQQGVPYYLGWSYKFSLPAPTSGPWACFQWKSYPDPTHPDSFTQNYPLDMTYDGQTLALISHGAHWTEDRSKIVKLWEHPVAVDKWVDIVLVINTSLDDRIGYVELYFNGTHQTLLTGGTRFYHKTMDGLEVAPKWGAYNRHAIGTPITVDLADLRVGTDLASVMPARPR